MVWKHHLVLDFGTLPGGVVMKFERILNVPVPEPNACDGYPDCDALAREIGRALRQMSCDLILGDHPAI